MGRPNNRRTIGGMMMACCCLWVVMASLNIVRAGAQFHGRADGSSSSYATSFNQPNYQALGIQQPSAHALGMRRSSRFWWQDSNDSPFKEGAGKKVGVRATLIDPPRAHSRPIQDLRQQNFAISAQQTSYSGTAGATFSGQISGGALPPPYPGCAAALKCVPEDSCDILGVMINQPVRLSPQQKEYRVPLMPCLNTETNQEGFCCRDPLYEDPWPADMPMPGMPAKPIAPVPAPTTAAVISVPPTPVAPQPTSGYPYQPAPSPSFPIPVPNTNYLPPTPVVQPPPPAPTPNYIPHQVPAQPSVPAPVRPVPVAPQVYTQAPPTAPQQPWTGELAPVTPHPGCAAALKCVPEEQCSLEGIMVNTPVRLTPYEKEYLRVPLMNCLNTETNQEGFCCRDPLYEDPWPKDMPMPGMAVKPLPVPVNTNSIAVVQQPAVAPVQQQYLPPPVPAPQTYQAPAPVQQTYQAPAPVQQTYVAPAPQQQVYQPAPVVQQPTYVAQPSAFQQQQQQPFKPYVGPLAADQPFPGCAAALKCVEEQFCNMEGVMVNEPVSLTPLQKEYRVPLMACLNIDTNKVGYCCRDPLYEDPWPADMPMPGMAKQH